MGGQRKLVTVMFADIRGSMALVSDCDPEVAISWLDPALAAMIAGVHRYGGTVNRIQGDGIMGLFGAPIAHEDHAVRACLAACAILDAISGARRSARSRCVSVIDSGQVLVRPTENDLAIDYDAVGATAHTANRLESMAEAGTAYVSATTFRLAQGAVEARSLGALSIRGTPAAARSVSAARRGRIIRPLADARPLPCAVVVHRPRARNDRAGPRLPSRGRGSRTDRRRQRRSGRWQVAAHPRIHGGDRGRRDRPRRRDSARRAHALHAGLLPARSRARGRRPARPRRGGGATHSREPARSMVGPLGNVPIRWLLNTRWTCRNGAASTRPNAASARPAPCETLSSRARAASPRAGGRGHPLDRSRKARRCSTSWSTRSACRGCSSSLTFRPEFQPRLGTA